MLRRQWRHSPAAGASSPLPQRSIASPPSLGRVVWMLVGLLAVCGYGARQTSAAGGGFQELATLRGTGSPIDTLVGPGPTPGSQRYYTTYAYVGGTAELVAVDPDTGRTQVFVSPNRNVSFFRGLVAGPDNKIYLGSVGEARLFRFDPVSGRLTDLGRPSATETYIWQLVVGTDGRIYGCTFPNAKLIRYDPDTGKMADLGRMDPDQQYARFIAASKDGFLYLAIGYGKNGLVAYRIASGEHRDILPKQFQDYRIYLHEAEDGTIYGRCYDAKSARSVAAVRLQGWEAEPVSLVNGRVPARMALPGFRDGRLISKMTAQAIDIWDPKTRKVVSRPLQYSGKEMAVFRLGMGPGERLYGSSDSPMRLVRIDPATGSTTPVDGVESAGGGVYSILRYRDRLLLAGYTTPAPIMVLDSVGQGGSEGAKLAPGMIRWKGADASWRPWAMIAGPDGKVYIGSTNGYGDTGGKLTVLNPDRNEVEDSFTVIPGQSVTSLAVWKGLVVGGTSVRGGGGAAATTGEARLFLWDPATQTRIFETTPVPGAKDITGVVTAPNGLVFGLAGEYARRNQLFVFDPASRKVVHQSALPSGIAINAALWNSIGVGPDRRLYGLCNAGIFSIDPETYQVRMNVSYPGGITAGFALIGGQIYFGSGARVMKYNLTH